MKKVIAVHVAIAFAVFLNLSQSSTKHKDKN